MQLKLWNTERKNYQLQITPENLASSAVQSAILEDAYLHTSVVIDLINGTKHEFQVTEEASSKNPYRFRVILNAKASSPAVTSESKADIRAYPNPVIGKTINVEFNNKPKGNYSIELINNKGQRVFTRTIFNEGGIFVKPVQLAGKLAKGVYHLQVSNGDVRNTISIMSE
jgi:hypothetical protein